RPPGSHTLREDVKLGHARPPSWPRPQRPPAQALTRSARCSPRQCRRRAPRSEEGNRGGDLELREPTVPKQRHPNELCLARAPTRRPKREPVLISLPHWVR